MSSVREKRNQVQKQQNREEERRRLGLESEPAVPAEEPAVVEVEQVAEQPVEKSKPQPKAAKPKARAKPKPKSGGKK